MPSRWIRMSCVWKYQALTLLYMVALLNSLVDGKNYPHHHSPHSYGNIFHRSSRASEMLDFAVPVNMSTVMELSESAGPLDRGAMQERLVVRGQMVAIECGALRVKGKDRSKGGRPKQIVHWYHDNKLVSEDSRVVINPINWRVEISHAISADSGVWRCVVDGSLPAFKLNLIVTIPPEPPYLEYAGAPLAMGARLTTRAGNALTLRCVVNGGNPEPTIAWYIGEKEVTSTSKFESVWLGDLSQYNTISNITVGRVDKSLHNTTVACLVSHPALPDLKAVPLKLNIQYPPNFKLRRWPGWGSPVVGGSDVSMQCIVDANPHSEPRWIKASRQEMFNEPSMPKFLKPSPKPSSKSHYKRDTSSIHQTNTSIYERILSPHHLLQPIALIATNHVTAVDPTIKFLSNGGGKRNGRSTRAVVVEENHGEDEESEMEKEFKRYWNEASRMTRRDSPHSDISTMEVSPNGWLNLTDVSSAERGWYQCVSKHDFGEFSSNSVFINVQPVRSNTPAVLADSTRGSNQFSQVPRNGISGSSSSSTDISSPNERILTSENSGSSSPVCWGRILTTGTPSRGSSSRPLLGKGESGVYQCNAPEDDNNGPVKLVITGTPVVEAVSSHVSGSLGGSVLLSVRVCSLNPLVEVLWLPPDRTHHPIKPGRVSGHYQAHNRSISPDSCHLFGLSVGSSSRQDAGVWILVARTGHAASAAPVVLTLSNSGNRVPEEEEEEEESVEREEINDILEKRMEEIETNEIDIGEDTSTRMKVLSSSVSVSSSTSSLSGCHISLTIIFLHFICRIVDEHSTNIFSINTISSPVWAAVALIITIVAYFKKATCNSMINSYCKALSNLKKMSNKFNVHFKT